MHRDYLKLRDRTPSSLHSTLLILIYISQLERKAHWFGSVLEAIASDIAFDRLSDWSLDNTFAQRLFELSGFLRNKRHDLFEIFTPLPKSVPAKKQLGSTKPSVHYVIWLLVEGLPDCDSADRDWLEIFRVWLLVHSFHRFITYEIVCDRYLCDVSTRLRAAFDSLSGWHQIVLLIKRTRVSSFNALNMALISDSSSRKPSPKDAELFEKCKPISTSLQQTFFNSVTCVAEYQYSENNDGGYQSIKQKIGAFSLFAPEPNDSELDQLKTTQDPDEPIKIVWPDEDDSIVVTTRDPNQSDEVNRLSANSILLDSAMDLQHLCWSYNRPNPAESIELDGEIHKQLGSASSDIRFVGLCVWIADRTFNTLRRATDMDISNEPAADWRMDTNYRFIHRLPPRMPTAWEPSEEHLEWIHPIVDSNVIPLPAVAREIILDRCKNMDEEPGFLRQCWNSDKSIEGTFRAVLPSALKRVWPSMLRRKREQKVFEASQDSVFTKMVAFHSGYAHSADLHYGSFSQEACETALKLDDLDSVNLRVFTSDTTCLGFGSRVSLVEDVLRAEIDRATSTLHSSFQGSDLINYHNALTAYAVVMLWAATACRPLNDPFEDARDFDLQQRFVYVEDKVSSEAHQGRIVPLTSQLVEFLSNVYPMHLRRLSKAIAPCHPVLSQSVDDLLDQKRNSIPYFFLLNDSENFGWHSVNGKSVRETGLFNHPLPSNLFRQRMPDQLRAHGVDPEIIDGFLGHLQTGSATYGDVSVRCWRADMDEIEPALESIYSQLGFVLPQPMQPRHKICGNVRLASTSSKIDFGQKSRELKRKIRFRNACKQTHGVIQAFLAGRSLTDLSEDEVDRLALQLARNENGRPHHDKVLRLNVLSRMIEKVERKSQQKVRQRHTYSKSLADKSLFNSGVTGSKSLHKNAVTALNKCIKNSYPNMSIARGRALAALSLIIQDRLTNIHIVRSVASGKNCRMTFISKSCYLEYSEDMIVESLTQASVRHAISSQSARLLGYALEKGEDPLHRNMEPYLSDLGGLFGCGSKDHLDKFIQVACRVIDQLNCIEYPGVIAGYLAGRVDSTGRPWSDWMRHAQGVQIEIESPSEGNNEVQVDTYLAPRNRSTVAGLDGHERAKELIIQLRTLLMDPKPKGCAESRYREALSKNVKKIAQGHALKQSELLILFAYWVAHLVTRKKSARKFLAMSTVLRYFHTLSRPFQDIGYQIPLTGMDSEEVTDFYCRLFEVRKVRDTRYVANRLAQFHAYCKTITHVEDPDWDELPVTAYRSVSPGYISEEDYQNILQFFHTAQELPHEVRVSIIMLLVFCYRFALRKNEALRLKREHYIKLNELIYIWVVPARGATHKSNSATRNVPLVFRLSNMESEYLDMGVRRYEGHHGEDYGRPLFPDADPMRIAAMATQGIKFKTGNPKLTLHHCRHSAAQRVGHALFMPVGQSAWPELPEFSDTEERELILKSELGSLRSNSRRSTWGLARFLGHAGPSTSMKSYLHFLCEWSCIARGASLTNKINKAPNNARALTELKQKRQSDAPPDLTRALTSAPEVTTVQLLKFLRLSRRGYPIEVASKTLGIPLKTARLLLSLVQLIDQKIRHIDIEGINPGTSQSIIHKIKSNSWDRIINVKQAAKGSESRQNNFLDMVGFEIWDLPRMIGANRQLGLWHPSHFEAIRTFLIEWPELRELMAVFYNPETNQRAAKLAKEYLDCTPRSAAQRTQGIPQLDVCVDGRFQIIQDRVMIVFSENADAAVRNSYEFMLLLTCWIVSAHCCGGLSCLPDRCVQF